jgi:hypothetical protein
MGGGGGGGGEESTPFLDNSFGKQKIFCFNLNSHAKSVQHPEDTEKNYYGILCRRNFINTLLTVKYSLQTLEKIV